MLSIISNTVAAISGLEPACLATDTTGAALSYDQKSSDQGKGDKAKTPDQKPTTPPPQQPPTPVLPPTAAAPPATDGQGNRLVSNSYTDTDIKQAFADLSAAADVTVSPDDSVSGNVTANFKNVTVPQALDILTTSGGYSWKKIGDVYLVGKAEPSSPNFFRFATTKVYKPNYSTAEHIASLLPTGEAAYVKTAAGERTITITAAQTMMDRIVSDIKLLDQPPVRIVLEAMVTEINQSNENKFSFSWNWRYFGISTDGTSTNTLTYAQASNSDVATMLAAINSGNAELKANPRVLAEDGKEASVEVSEEQWFEAVSGPSGFAYSQLQQIKTGISLKVTPYLSDDGQITMILNPQVSNVSGTTTSGLPIDTVRNANTTVRVKDGETVAIGGMTYTTESRSHSRIPILGDIPILGNLFRFHDDSKSKTDVVIMITPHVLKD
jgi:type IV pilus assembly protein PilQ